MKVTKVSDKESHVVIYDYEYLKVWAEIIDKQHVVLRKEVRFDKLTIESVAISTEQLKELASLIE